MNQPNRAEFMPDDQEITLLEGLKFIKKSYKIILLWTFLGLVGAVGYLIMTPPLYEATAQIRMAQISQVNTANPFGATVEDPVSLIARMQIPTNYPPSVVEICSYQERAEPALSLARDVKFTIPRGTSNTVELKVLGATPKIAESCAEAIFFQIAYLQEQFSKIFVEEAKAKLIADNERIEAARKLIAKADQSGFAMSAAYISARDELTYFLTDREKMMDLINSVKNRGTRLSSPIYVSEKPVSPKILVSLIVGSLVGIFLGLVIALVTHQFHKLKSNTRHAF